MVKKLVATVFVAFTLTVVFAPPALAWWDYH